METIWKHSKRALTTCLWLSSLCIAGCFPQVHLPDNSTTYVEHLQAADTFCNALPEAQQVLSPLRRYQVSATRPVHRRQGKARIRRTHGVQFELRTGRPLRPGVMTLAVHCHMHRYALQGNHAPTDDPLALPGVSARVRHRGTHYEVLLTSADHQTAVEVLARTERSSQINYASR